MNKEEIDEILAFYKKDFFIKTGLRLACIVACRRKDASIRLRKRIVQLAPLFFNITQEELLSTSRVEGVTEARTMCAQLFKSTGLENQKIASFLNRDRTSVCHMLQRFKKNSIDKKYIGKYNNFKKYVEDSFIEDSVKI